MNRVVLVSYIKKGIYMILVFLSFLILLPILILGLGNGNSMPHNASNKTNTPAYTISQSDIEFSKTNMGAPNIKVYITKENKIEEMNLEEYVRGVVAAEMPAEFGIEALKAQAVAARTYALSHMEQYNGIKCSQAKGADVCDTVHSQAYIKKETRLESWPQSKRELYWNKITDAVKETVGQVLLYDGQLAMNIRYFSTSSGKTEDSTEVFASSVPYLKSVSSPGEESAPKYKSTEKFSYSEAANKINKAYPNAKVSASNLRSQLVVLNPRSTGGSVKQIKVGSATITGSQFRSVFDLNSANFELKFNKNDIEIITYGYGHGLGMSQWGANAMSKEGRDYVQILTHYYQGIKVEEIYR